MSAQTQTQIKDANGRRIAQWFDSVADLFRPTSDAYPLPTLETASMGFDPSTGRTPVEQTNNSAYTALISSLTTAVLKAAPGFLHNLQITVVGTAVATHLAVYDNSASATGALLHVLPLPAPGAHLSAPLDVLFTTGLAIAPCSVNVATGAVTNVAPTTAYSVLVSASYR